MTTIKTLVLRYLSMSDINCTYMRQCLSYDPISGNLYWKVAIPNLGILPGHLAGSRDSRYSRVKLRGKQYPVHVIAWYLHTGEWRIGELDHIDRDGFNNKIDNLRVVTKSQNQYNRSQKFGATAPLPGVRYRHYKWEVAVGTKYIGRASTLIDAAFMRFNALNNLGVAL